MRQIGAEKDDPLKRIQEEINEVARRERELREKMQNQTEITTTGDLVDSTTLTTNTTTIKNNENNCNLSTSPTPSQSVSQDDTPSLASSVNSKESLDEHNNSDDSGISASSSPINGISSIKANNNNNNNGKSIKKYIRPNGYNSIPSPLPQKLLTRTVSTPQIYTPTTRRITFGPAQKGLMQRFIATRGKISTNNNNYQQNIMTKDLNGNINNYNNNNNGISPIDYQRQSLFIPTITMTPPIIERDSDGKPIRRGYVPVEEKIQKELKDIKCRETELKKIRRLSIRQSQPDLLDSIENETMESDDDSDIEHCYPPGKLRSSKSISELCESINSNSISPRTTPSPNFDRSRSGGMRPAISLAQLCDLSPAEEAPSSHQLIAKWESLIQQNA